MPHQNRNTVRFRINPAEQVLVCDLRNGLVSLHFVLVKTSGHVPEILGRSGHIITLYRRRPEPDPCLTPFESFRRNAVHVRQALELFKVDPGKVGVEGGYLQDAGMVERYKRLSIPVRRALNPGDRASVVEALAAIQPTGEMRLRLPAIKTAWEKLQAELDHPIMLGGTKVPRRQILAAWLDARGVLRHPRARQGLRPADRSVRQSRRGHRASSSQKTP